jgi:hypothetical protein
VGEVVIFDLINNTLVLMDNVLYSILHLEDKE